MTMTSGNRFFLSLPAPFPLQATSEEVLSCHLQVASRIGIVFGLPSRHNKHICTYVKVRHTSLCKILSAHSATWAALRPKYFFQAIVDIAMFPRKVMEIFFLINKSQSKHHLN